MIEELEFLVRVTVEVDGNGSFSREQLQKIVAGELSESLPPVIYYNEKTETCVLVNKTDVENR